MGDPVTVAQGPGAADRARTGTHSRAVRRCARFSDLLGALAEGSGPTEEKRKADQASGASPGPAFPLFPLGPGKDAALYTDMTPKLGPMAPGGPGDAIASVLVALDAVDVDLALQSATPQTNAIGLGGHGLLPGADREQAPAAKAVPSMKAALINEDGLSAKADRAQPVSENGLLSLQTLTSATEQSGVLTRKAAISSVFEVCSPGMARNGLQPGVSQRWDLTGERTDRADLETPSGSASAVAGGEPLFAPTPDPVRLGTPLAAPASDAVVETAAPAGGSAQHRDDEAPAGLAFTARVVPVPAGDVGVPATGADLQQPVFSGAKPAADRTPVPSAPHFANNPKREDSSEVTVRTAMAEPPVVSSLAPAASTETAVPQASESGRAEPAAPHSPPNGLTEAKTTPQTSPAREIQLQFHQGDQRLDVRLSERSGEMQVTVRTPDAQLAAALRAGLPALSARLEQTGFRAETWHPAIAHESARPAGHVSPSVSDSSDSRNESRQGGQRQPQPRQQRFNTAHAAKTQRKEFRWFMSQLP
jgi:hypothetical protein